MTDRRDTLVLDGAADARLEGCVAAERYDAVELLQARVAAVAVRPAPSAEAALVTQLLLGERFDVLERRRGWAFGQARRDGYVGWVRADDLGAPETPTHHVVALRAPAFARPDLKSGLVAMLSLNALATGVEREGRFVRTAAGWAVEAHLAPVGTGFARDPVATARRFLGAAYVWGGRESDGLDCSGLVQAALHACGRACPRDSDQQRALGRAVDPADAGPGDLLFWPGHVAWLGAPDRLLHANAHWMAVVEEPLTEALARMGAPDAARRL